MNARTRTVFIMIQRIFGSMGFQEFCNLLIDIVTSINLENVSQTRLANPDWQDSPGVENAANAFYNGIQTPSKE